MGLADLSEEEITKLAQALLDEQERMLPEGDTWESIDDGEKAYYYNSALAVVHKLRELRG